MDEKVRLIRTDAAGRGYEVDQRGLSRHRYAGTPTLEVDGSQGSHPLLGFGASMTDASAWLLTTLTADARARLLDDLFGADGLNLSIVRTNVGSSDYATEVYCYDDVPGDEEMRHFSVAHDEAYLIPTLREVKEVCPDVFLFSSMWSCPGWMKLGGEMCGGYVRRRCLPALANYYTEYLKAYREHGLELDAYTIQNEPCTHQRGLMPAGILHPEYEMELHAELMPPRLAAAGLHPQVWMFDHNYCDWSLVAAMLDEPEVRRHVDAVAFHPYDGDAGMLSQLLARHPGMTLHMTEKGPNLDAVATGQDELWWTESICQALNHGCSSYVGWNIALDEFGCPNVGPFRCSGLVEIHTGSQAITPSAQYRAFRHFAPFARRGAEILHCCREPDWPAEIQATAFRNPDGGLVLVFGNKGRQRMVQIHCRDAWLQVILTPKSVSTLVLEP